MKKTSLFVKVIAIFLALQMVGLAERSLGNTIEVAKVKKDGPPPTQSIFAALCVVVIVGIFVGYGACGAKKLIDKIPPVAPPPPKPPVTPPPATNAPPVVVPPKKRVSLNSASINTNGMNLFVPTSGLDCEGMIRWNVATNGYRNSSNGQPFITVVTSSILASTNANAPISEWSVVGSRVAWENPIQTPNGFNTNGGMLLVYYGANGQWRGQEYFPYSLVTATNGTPNPRGTDDYGVNLLADEIGYDYSKRFFRLVSPTNFVGVLVNGEGGY